MIFYATRDEGWVAVGFFYRQRLAAPSHRSGIAHVAEYVERRATTPRKVGGRKRSVSRSGPGPSRRPPWILCREALRRNMRQTFPFVRARFFLDSCPCPSMPSLRRASAAKRPHPEAVPGPASCNAYPQTLWPTTTPARWRTSERTTNSSPARSDSSRSSRPTRSGGERNGSRSRERKAGAREHCQVGVERDFVAAVPPLGPRGVAASPSS